MAQVRRKLMGISEDYHHLIHILIGWVFAFGVFLQFRPVGDRLFLLILLVSILGSILPDFDHFLSIFFYGRHSEYSKISKKYLKSKEIRNLVSFWKENHKFNTKIYSHNAGSIVLATLIAIYFVDRRDDILWASFYVSWAVHYYYDILEDILYFSKLNKNWFFMFGKGN